MSLLLALVDTDRAEPIQPTVSALPTEQALPLSRHLLRDVGLEAKAWRLPRQ